LPRWRQNAIATLLMRHLFHFNSLRHYDLKMSDFHKAHPNAIIENKEEVEKAHALAHRLDTVTELRAAGGDIEIHYHEPDAQAV